MENRNTAIKLPEILGTDLFAVGAPLSLSHLDTLPHQHRYGEAHEWTCEAWGERVVTVRSGHTFKLGLLCLQARELRDYVERVSVAGDEGAILEALVFAAAINAQPTWLSRAKSQLRFAEIELERTRRDGYHYAQVVESRKVEVAFFEALLGDLLYDEAIKSAPANHREAA